MLYAEDSRLPGCMVRLAAPSFRSPADDTVLVTVISPGVPIFMVRPATTLAATGPRVIGPLAPMATSPIDELKAVLALSDNAPLCRKSMLPWLAAWLLIEIDPGWAPS